MKVLMLGWEFPPHISGGLGTACFGLTRGLDHEGVDVKFVVPRAHGDEHAGHVSIIGCNQVRLQAGTVTPPQASAPAGARYLADQQRSAATNVSAIQRSFELLAVDSLLSPYLGEEEYRRRYEAHAQDATEAGAAQCEARWTELWKSLAELPGFAGIGPRLDRAVRGAGRLEFSGRYGPDLMTEVARYAVAVGEIARAQTFDVVHAHDWMTYPAGMVAAAIARKPLVVHMHASEFDRSGEKVNERIKELECLGLFGSTRVICVSNYTARVMRDRYHVPVTKLRVVHNAVEQDGSRTVEHSKAIEEPIVLFLGRVTFQKGPDYFLEAAARVVRLEPKVKFVMAGSGDMLPEMVERCARMGLARHVHFTGFLRGKEVERMYSMADVYVMPSVSEPFGISPLEAMALDVPVIVSRQSGVSEILHNALKVDFWDVEDLSNKILALLEYAPLRKHMRDEGREEVRDIRWERPARLVRDVYEEVAS